MPVLLSETIDQFIVTRRAARYSPHTLNDYQNTYRKFRAHLGCDLPFSAIDVSHIVQFMASDPVASVSKKTALNYHTGLSSLWSWAVKRNLVENNIVRWVEPPSPEQREIIPYTRSEIVRLLTTAYASRNKQRDEAILLTLLDTGIRASEICIVKIQDANRYERRLNVYGKGDKERQVKLSHRTIDSIFTYLETRGIRNHRKFRQAPLFLTIQNKQMSRNTIRLLMDRLEDRSEVYNVYAHRFRHTFAITFLRNGGNIYTLQKLLGHTTLEMVRRYLKISQIDLDNDHDRASPVANWGI